MADEHLDRKAERPLERQEVRQALNPSGHQLQRDEAAGEQHLRRHVEVEHGGASRRPEVQHPDHALEHAADQIGAPDREDEDDDLERGRMEVRLEHERQADRDRHPQAHDHELPAGEVGEVEVKDVHRPEELPGELALANAPLPERRSEDDVHVANERPDDVVRRELPGGDSVDRPAVLVRDRRPHHQLDHRLGDHPQHVEVVRDAVLQLFRDSRPHGRYVEVEQRAPAAFLPQLRDG